MNADALRARFSTPEPAFRSTQRLALPSLTVKKEIQANTHFYTRYDKERDGGARGSKEGRYLLKAKF